MSADRQEPPVPLAEISQGPNAFEEFLDRNQKNIIILAILLVIATAALVIYRGIEKSSQDTAGVALNKAEDLASLQAVISEHPGTQAALSAKVLLADRQWTDGQQDAAIETLRAFVAASPEHPAYPAAKASLGSKLMIQGKSEDASRIFLELVDEPNARYVAPYALISLGDMARVTGDLDKAEASYKRVAGDFSESPFVETATKRIATLKAKPPVEIEPPPAPEATAPSAPTTSGSIIPSPAPPTAPPAAVAPPAAAPQQETTPETTEKDASGEPPSNPNP
jgi:predicted negative regulator of RcsB-dependent stress response